MASIINASATGVGGVITTADASGVLQLQSNGTTSVEVTNSTFKFNSGYGSVATAYGCRAWIEFNGTGTPSAYASGNISSITDNGTGDYILNFSTAMPDANYSAIGTVGGRASTFAGYVLTTLDFTSANIRVYVVNGSNAAVDVNAVSVAIFR